MSFVFKYSVALTMEDTQLQLYDLKNPSQRKYLSLFNFHFVYWQNVF